LYTSAQRARGETSKIKEFCTGGAALALRFGKYKHDHGCKALLHAWSGLSLRECGAGERQIVTAFNGCYM
jgi:hypothetical protein